MKRKNTKVHYICPYCIEAIRSHGEKILVGDLVDCDEYYEQHEKEPVCYWCEEPEDELREVVFR